MFIGNSETMVIPRVPKALSNLHSFLERERERGGSDSGKWRVRYGRISRYYN